MDFNGRHVVVTGGTGVLGAAVVGELLAAGALCHVPNLVAAELDGFAYAADERVGVALEVDLAEEGAVESFYAALPDLWASVHVAGGFAMAPLAEIDAAAFRAQMDLNALSCHLCCRAAIANMRGGPSEGGRIVNVAARPALEPRQGAGMVAYTASKAAVAALTQALAEELKDEAIWVNAVAPSILDTPANRAAMPSADFAAWPKVAEVAAVIAFLASPQNLAARGAVVPVYGKS
jgi:NAD(P)-dependent dehydrogenase (short-subunit alcohol dehydrogenase family)